MTHHRKNRDAQHTLFKLAKLPNLIRFGSGVSLVLGAVAMAPTALAQVGDEGDFLEEIVVTGQRASILSAQEIKRSAEQIVDSIVADDIGKLPDRSVTEALQRVPGVTIERFIDIGDPEHFSAEGSGVAIRGMSHVRSELNGRDSFSASGGRSLSFEDVPSELMAGVDVYKNPSADMIEGGLGGTVNLRTRMPFDADGQYISISASANYGDFIKETKPSISGLYSNRWDTNIGEIGFLFDLAYSEIATRTDGIFNRPSFARTDLEEGTVWVPRGADWRSMEFQRERTGAYAALQWRPNEQSEVYFTAFRSAYDMQWNEDAIFVQNDPWNIQPENATYDENGVFLSGRLVDTNIDGISFGSDVRVSTRDSVTTDFSGGYKWVEGNWEISTDLQYTESTSEALDLTLALGVNLPYLDLDNTGSLPRIGTDAEYLGDYSNYFWGFTMPHLEDNKASQVAWRADVQYNFENDTPLRSIKGGVRFTDREADNIDTSYNWVPLYQTWMYWWALDPQLGIPTIQDTTNLNRNSFENFFRGGSPAPSDIWAPTVDLALGYPDSFHALHEMAFNDAYAAGHNPEASGGAIDYAWAGSHPYPYRDPSDPEWNNIQSENTYAAYGLLRFGFDDLPMPIDGNIGLRVVRTESTASGYMIYPTGGFSAPIFNPAFDPSLPEDEQVGAVPIDAENSYTNVLPSLNLRMTLSDNLYWRVAMSQAISRPYFHQLKAYQQLNASVKDGVLPDGAQPGDEGIALTPDDFNLTSSLWTNPYLEPLEADQFDTSLEWYFDDRGGMAHINLFYKDIDGIVRNQATTEVHNGHEYDVTRPVNAGSAKIQGFEMGYSQFYDFLPGLLSGLGLQVNYTYIDSSTDIPLSEDPDNPDAQIAPLDTDGTLLDDNLPYEGLSKNAFNFIAMYEYERFSARLAWSWRSKYLMAIGPNGYNGGDGGVDGNEGVRWRLPIWSDDTGQLDGSVFYRVTDNVTIGLEANNLTNEQTRTIMRQSAGDRYASHFVNDTRYALTIRANF